MKKRWLLLFLLCLLLNGCTAATSGRYLISAVEGSWEYSVAIHPFLSGYTLQEPSDTLYAEMSRGNVVACFDVQAIPAMERGIGRYWYPHLCATVVLAVDRTRTDVAITGWNSLLESPVSVGLRNNSVIRNMLVMGALSYGLNPEEPQKKDALDLLEQLCQNEGFELENSNAPVLICLDYEAAAWNREGGNYEIIVPAEGTLSYQIGLLSDSPLTLKPGLDAALLSAGLPLASGDRPLGFPGDYGPACLLGEKDYDWFLELTGDSSRDLRRQVFHTRLYTTADLREHILSAILLAVATLLWKGTVTHRLVRRDVRRMAGVLCWLIVGWLLLRLLKYQLFQEGILSRMCWYGYYIFQLALPVALSYLTEILDRAEEERSRIRPLWPPLVCYLLSVLLVLTNDFHQLVFFFETDSNWSHDYHYGMGYWIVLGLSLFFLISAIWKLLRMGRRNSYGKKRLFPLLFCLALLVYIAAYIKRVPLAWESDFTVNICLLSILFFEAVLHAGLIPVNIQYRRLFTSAPISLTLLDENGCTVLSSCGARPISYSVWKKLHMDMEQPLLRDRDTQFRAIPIRGGMAVWQEDISQLNRLRKEIQDIQIRLEAANTLLREEGEVKKRLLTAETNRVLFEQLDRDMERRIASLVRLVETLPETDRPESMTAYITLCLCHLKRRCNLFFLTRQGEVFLGDELSIYLDELADLAGYAGVQTLIRCGTKGALETRSAALCYDFAFESICWVLRMEASPLMGYLESEGTRLVFRFLPGADPRKWCFSEELMREMSALDGKIVCKDLDDAVGICMTLPLGGETSG